MSIINLVTKIIANDLVAKNHFRMRIQCPEISASFVAGQFVMIKARAQTYDPLIKIPLGIHQKHDDGISVLYRVVGSGTEILSKLRAGDEVEILGPLGNGFSVTEHKNNLLVAGGFGAAPLYALAESLHQQQKNIAVFLGAQNKDLIICTDDFKKLGATIYIATEDGTCGEKCLVTDLLAEHLVKDTMLYACGPNAMLKQIVRIVREQKIPAQLSMEAYMACGIGACRGCAIQTNEGYKMCCQDGPVFEIKEL
jgi:dihydroorotate dehydrogenase electron transfer subunit